MRLLVTACALVFWSATASAQVVSERGFVDGRLFLFPQKSPDDTTQVVGNGLIREEVFFKPAEWFQFAAGVDFRASSHDEVEDEWRLDFSDRGILRPRLAVRRVAATIAKGPLTVTLGKQVVRWARADVLNPTDRFAARDYVNPLDSELLPVLAVRPTLQLGRETFEVVWAPRLTPSRMPLLDQRWTVVPEILRNVPLADAGSDIPQGSETGVRWSHAGDRLETALSYFDGFNNLPNIAIHQNGPTAPLEFLRSYPAVRTYGVDLAIPTGWLTIKGEGAYITAPTNGTDDYVLYVVEIERQIREWILVAGYAGEVVTQSRNIPAFAPDRGIARSILARAAYTVDPRRTIAIEGAIRQNGDGEYVKFEYTQSIGQHWRYDVSAVGLGGEPDDFLGQYRLNSHLSLGLRLSF